MSKLEVLVIVVALVNVAAVVEFVRRRELQEGFALLWIGTGVAGVAFALGRSLVDRIARGVGVTYGANLVLAGGILFLMLVAMTLSLHVSRLETKVELLAEEVAAARLSAEERLDDSSG